MRRLISVVMALMMLVTMNTSMLAMSYGAVNSSGPKEEVVDSVRAGTVTPEKMANSIDKVSKALEELKKAATTTKEVSDFQAAIDVFTGFIGVCGTAMSVIGVINSTTSFMKLIGVMKDSSANITEQLNAINDKLKEMDEKLDKLSEQMTRVEAKGDFNERGATANQMTEYWHSFYTHYMEEQMDECIRRYETMQRDGMKEWIEDRTDSARQSEDYMVRTDKVVIQYRKLKAPWKSSDVDDRYRGWR